MVFRKRNEQIDLAKYKEDNKKGVILEVDLEYPQELHDLHNDYPLAPEKMKVTKRCYLPTLQINKRKIQYQHRSRTHKLIPTLNNKEKYVL